MLRWSISLQMQSDHLKRIINGDASITKLQIPHKVSHHLVFQIQIQHTDLVPKNHVISCISSTLPKGSPLNLMHTNWYSSYSMIIILFVICGICDRFTNGRGDEEQTDGQTNRLVMKCNEIKSRWVTGGYHGCGTASTIRKQSRVLARGFLVGRY